jgi:hypothetical protein
VAGLWTRFGRFWGRKGFWGIPGFFRLRRFFEAIILARLPGAIGPPGSL